MRKRKLKLLSPTRRRYPKRGFASMPPERVTEIARQGGETVAARPGHMAEIGRLGGSAPHKTRPGPKRRAGNPPPTYLVRQATALVRAPHTPDNK